MSSKAVPEPPADFAAAMCATWSALCVMSSSSSSNSSGEESYQGEERPDGSATCEPAACSRPQASGTRTGSQAAGSILQQASAREPVDASKTALQSSPAPAEPSGKASEMQRGLCMALPLGTLDALGEPAGFLSCREPPPVIAELGEALRRELRGAGEEPDSPCSFCRVLL